MNPWRRREEKSLAPEQDDDTSVGIEQIDQVMQRVAAGDLDARVVCPQGPEPVRRLAAHVNSSLDLMEAFTREANASLRATAQGRFHRVILRRGVPGMFEVGADSINAARQAVLERDQALTARDLERRGAAQQVAAAASHLSDLSTALTSATQQLLSSVDAAMTVAESAMGTMHTLESTSSQIQQAVTLIASVASQTRLLALNATIEAARAGEVGRGFAVVANEVKDLANETTSSSDTIASQVDAAQKAAAEAGQAIAGIAQAVRDIELQIGQMADGVQGSAGLAALAGMLTTQVQALARD